MTYSRTEDRVRPAQFVINSFNHHFALAISREELMRLEGPQLIDLVVHHALSMGICATIMKIYPDMDDQESCDKAVELGLIERIP